MNFIQQRHRPSRRLLLYLLGGALWVTMWDASAASAGPVFPPALESYGDAHLTNVWEVLQNRVRIEPFNLWATVLFLGALIHTFLTKKFLDWSHAAEERHQARLRQRVAEGKEAAHADTPQRICMTARVLHFFGEVEAVFGMWVLPLFVMMCFEVGLHPSLEYLNNRVSYIEPVFVVVIMVISSTRPIIQLAEKCLRFFARLGGGGPGAWWLSILTVGPMLGSLITEPAAMTISALLLGRQFYALKPDPVLAHATLGLLFVNVSVGGVLTHFAAPPVLMVAGPWNWDTPYMLRHFGLAAITGIVIANVGYYVVFRRRIASLATTVLAATRRDEDDSNARPIPAWVTIGHLGFLGWAVATAHYPALVIGGFLFFVAFFEVTADFQSELQTRSPILVGFFLAGLVIHGGLQQWWIAPLLGRMSEFPLMLGAIGLTAFNDNAAVTYLSTLVPNLSDAMKHAVVAGAVTGGGLTVIANAPNPAGQAILGKYFDPGISPLGLFLAALPATVILAICFLCLR